MRGCSCLPSCTPLVPSRIRRVPSDRTHHAARRLSITLATDQRTRCSASPRPSPFPRASARVPPRLARAGCPLPAHPSAPRRPTPRTRASRSSSTATASSSRPVRAANADPRAARAPSRRPVPSPDARRRPASRRAPVHHADRPYPHATRDAPLPPRPLAHVRPFPATQRSFTAARITRRSSTLSSPSTARRWTGPWSTTTSSPTPSAAESRR